MAISSDTGTAGDRITSDSLVQVAITLANALTLAGDETLQVSGDGSTWVAAAGSGTSWSTANNAVTLSGTGTITARIVDTAGNTRAITLTGNNYTLDTANPTPTVSSGIAANTANATVQSTETGTAYLVKTGGTSPVTVTNLASITGAADAKFNSVAITSANSDTSLSLAGLEDGTYTLYTEDAAGNLSAASTNTYTVDSTAPVLDIDSSNAGTLNASATTKTAYSTSGGTSAINLGTVTGSSITFDTWVSLDAFGYSSTVNGTTVFPQLVNISPTDGMGDKIAVYMDGPNNLYCSAWASDGSLIGTIWRPITWALNTWHHLGFIIDTSGYLVLFVDGVKVFFDGWRGGYTTFASKERSITLGNDASGTAPFDATFSDVRVYTGREYSAIARDMAGALETTNANLKLAYSLNGSLNSSLSGGSAATSTGTVSQVNTATPTSLDNASGTAVATEANSIANIKVDFTSGFADSNANEILYVGTTALTRGMSGSLTLTNSNGTIAWDGATTTTWNYAYSGTTMTFTSASTITAAMAQSFVQHLAYANKAGDANAVQDALGNDALSLVGQSVANTNPVEISSLTASSGGFAINAQVGGAGIGHGNKVNYAGDVNGDGLSDLIMGSRTSGASPLYLVFGQTSSTPIELSDVLAGTGGFALNQSSADGSVVDVNTAGDVNGDGLADLIIGASLYGATDTGGAYVVFGKTSTSPVTLSALGSGGFLITGQGATDYAGTSVSAAGDVNGDGLADLIVGAYQFDPAGATNAGRSYVVFGKTTTTTVALGSLGTGGFVINGETTSDNSGISVSAAGDVNGDGLADLIVGAYTAEPGATLNTGISYVVFGQTGTTAINLSAVVSGSGGFAIYGPGANNYVGKLVNDAGDVNGDGLADLIVSGADDNSSVYVVFGKTSGTAVSLTDLQLGGAGGFTLTNTRAGTGYSVSSAGDYNGDGLADLLVAASVEGAGTKGYAYLVFGKTSTGLVDMSAVERGVGGFLIQDSRASTMVSSINAAGDVNGDGLADLIIGMTNDNSNYGRSYVIFGSTTGTLGAGTAFDWQGTSGDDTRSSTGSQALAAGAGNDTLTSSGADVLYGGMGNDTFILDAGMVTALQNAMGAGGNVLQLARVDGGAGVDTLQLNSSSLNLDLTLVANQAASNPLSSSRISSIERINLGTEATANTLKLGLNDVLDMTGMNLFNTGNGWTNSSGTPLSATVQRHQLVIDGNGNDTVQVSGGSNWTLAGEATSSISGTSQTYNVWNHNSSAAQMLIDSDITRTAVL